MLQEPTEFAAAVQALLSTKQHFIENGSKSAGEHMCFIGSGRELEDQYLHMVIAYFLQVRIALADTTVNGMSRRLV